VQEVPTEAAKLLIGSGTITENEAKSIAHPPLEGTAPTAKSKSAGEKMLAAAKVIAANATKPKEWAIGRWIVLVRKSDKTGPAAGDDKE